MTPLRRTPREVYRVYSEEEFLGGLDHEDREDRPCPASGRDAEHVDADLSPSALPARRTSRRRALRVAMLAACLGVGVGLLAMGRPQSPSGSGSPPSNGSRAIATSTHAEVSNGGAPPARIPSRSPLAQPRDGARAQVRAESRKRAPGLRTAHVHLSAEAEVGARPANRAPLVASAASGPHNAEVLEFGFEH
jgi:hypothetical protein